MKRLTITLLVLLALTFAALAASVPEPWTGTCVGISDGDTISVMKEGKAVKIRLAGIDCPEKKQDYGTRARQFTASLAFGKDVKVEPESVDRYGRIVAWINAPDGTSINKALVKVGYAWWYKQYAKSNTELKDLEAEARKGKLGLWSLPDPVPPWEFRKKKK